jgi:hypothetical protein
LKTVHYSAEQSPSANGHHHCFGQKIRSQHFFNDRGVSLPKQRIVKWMDESIMPADKPQSERMGLIPGFTHYNYFCALLFEQFPGQ